jgi:hypothetical protein
LCIHTAFLVSDLFHLHGISGLSFSSYILLLSSLVIKPFKQPFLVPISLSILLVHPIFGPFLTGLAIGAVLFFPIP